MLKYTVKPSSILASCLLSLLFFYPLAILSDDSQCASLTPVLNDSGDNIIYYEMRERIETPLIPENISQQVPSYTNVDKDITLLNNDDDAKILPASLQFKYQQKSLPHDLAPLIMIHPNPDKYKLRSVELAAISSSECIQGVIEATGQKIVCTNTTPIQNPFSGNYLFRYYELEDERIVQKLEKPFSITNESFVPIHPISLETDGTFQEGKKLIARGIIIDVSAENIIPDQIKPSYVSIQYIPEQDLSDATLKADKFIYIPFSASFGMHPTTNTRDSDYLRVNFDSEHFELNLYEMTHTAHLAASYAMSDNTAANGIHTISTCDELRTLNGSTHTNIKLEDNITCNPNTSFAPIMLNRAVTLNGNNKTISGIRIDTVGNDGAGLFTDLPSGSSISNLTLTDISVVGGNASGILAGSAGGDNDKVTISHVRVSGDSTVTGHNYVGGLLGIAENVELSYVSSDADVTVNCSEGGGLVGHISNANISKSYSESEVRATAQEFNNCHSVLGGIAGSIRSSTFNEVQFQGGVFGERQIGGIAGRISSSSSIKNSSVEGTVQILENIVFDGAFKIVGGIAAVVENSTIEKSFTRGTLFGEQVIGGIVGQLSGASRITNSFSTATVTSSRGQAMELPRGGLIVGELLHTSKVTDSLFFDAYYIHNQQACSSPGSMGLVTCTAGPWYDDDPSYNVCSAFMDPSTSISNCESAHINDIYQYGTTTWNSSTWNVGRYRIPELRDEQMLRSRSTYDMKYSSPF